MPRNTKTWSEKMAANPPHVVKTDKNFAGVPAGSRLLISSPMEVAAFLRSHLPPGTTKEIQQLRRDLAALHQADATCPVSTAFFLKIVAEDAWDQLEAGASTLEVAPFWRVVNPDSALASRLRAGSAWIAQQRDAEKSSQCAQTA
jgi:hypothetical protein